MKISKHPLREQNEKDSGSRFLELCGSIKVHGLICPIIVREVNDYYEVIDGTRRLHAFRAMGIHRTPVYIIENLDGIHALCASLTLNVIRLDEEENKKTIKRTVLNSMEA